MYQAWESVQYWLHSLHVGRTVDGLGCTVLGPDIAYLELASNRFGASPLLCIIMDKLYLVFLVSVRDYCKKRAKIHDSVDRLAIASWV